MITLGLQRITALLNPLFATHPVLPWRAVHIAGTNGKGSVAALISIFLGHLGYRVGRFTSPHIIDRWDCITINRAVVDRDKFLAVEKHFRERSTNGKIDASEFEILTATAFQLFTNEKVDVGVIECGLGGRQDATNVLRSRDVILSVLTKVGLDHVEDLGDTIEAITTEKAGIFKPFVPVVVDQSNEKAVFEAVTKRLKALDWDTDGAAGIYLSLEERRMEFAGAIGRLKLGKYQAQNLYTAWSAFRRAEQSLSLTHASRQPLPTGEPPPRAQLPPGTIFVPGLAGAPDDYAIYGCVPFPTGSVRASLDQPHCRCASKSTRTSAVARPATTTSPVRSGEVILHQEQQPQNYHSKNSPRRRTQCTSLLKDYPNLSKTISAARIGYPVTETGQSPGFWP